MIFPPNYALFCAGAFALILSPGPDFFYVLTRGIAGGRGAGLFSALGIGAGLLVHTALAASGLTLLLLASSALFSAVKWLGALYLIWIGYKMVRSGEDFLAVPSEKRDFKPFQVFQQGVLTNILNPKVALTFAAFVLPFVDQKRGGEAGQILFLGRNFVPARDELVLHSGNFCGAIRRVRVASPARGTLHRARGGRDFGWLGTEIRIFGALTARVMERRPRPARSCYFDATLMTRRL